MLHCNSDLSTYMKQISKYKLLSRKEEIALMTKSRLQGPTRSGEPLGTAAKHRLMCCNTRLVISYAKKYRVPGVELDDLIAAGNLGLDTAAERFDLTRGVRFATYASAWIKNRIFELIKKRFLVHVPYCMQEEFYHPEKRKRKNPSRCLEAARRIIEAERCTTIEDETGHIWYQTDILPAREEEAPWELEDREAIVAKMLASLTEIQRKVLHMRIWQGKTLQEVAEHLGCVRERVRQVQNQALLELREKYDESRD